MKIKKHSEKRFIIETELTSEIMKDLANLPSYKKWEGRSLIASNDCENIQYLIKNFPDAIWDESCISDKQKYIAIQQIGNIKNVNVSINDEYIYKRPPLIKQREGFLLTRDLPIYGIFMEQGTGKTKLTIDTACYLYLKKEIEMLIVIAWPNGVHRNWIETEIENDIPINIPYKADFWQTNLTKKKENALMNIYSFKESTMIDFNKAKTVTNIKDFRPLKILTFNVECFVNKKAQDFIVMCLNKHKTLLVIDQSASIKNPSAKRTQFITKKLAPLAMYKRILDGSPIAEAPEEIYSQFYFLDPAILNCKSFASFKAQYCIIEQQQRSWSGNKFQYQKITGYKNLDKLQEKIAQYSFRVLASECLDLPEKTYKKWLFDLNSSERKIYNDMRKQSFAFFKEGDDFKDALIENLAMIKTMRLQQISCGWWPHKKDFKAINERGSRLSALTTLLSQCDGKALIFSRFRADLDIIQISLKEKAVSYHGGITEDQRALNKKAFMEDESIKYFIGQPRAAGIGHTLTAAKHVIFYCNDTSLRFREECERRAYRQGLKHNLIIWDLIASDTHDIKILKCLLEKKKISEEILKDCDQFFLQ